MSNPWEARARQVKAECIADCMVEWYLRALQEHDAAEGVAVLPLSEIAAGYDEAMRLAWAERAGVLNRARKPPSDKTWQRVIEIIAAGERMAERLAHRRRA